MPLTSPKFPPQVVVIFPDEDIAFDTYRFLQSHGISPENMVLVGEGFTSPEYLGCLMSPRRIAWQSAQWGFLAGLGMGCFLAGIFFLGALFSQWFAPQVLLAITGIVILTIAALGGICGWLHGFLYRSELSIKCQSYLRQGQYLLLLEGSELVVRRGREILNRYSNQLDI